MPFFKKSLRDEKTFFDVTRPQITSKNSELHPVGISLFSYNDRAKNLIIIGYSRYVYEYHTSTKNSPVDFQVPNWTTLHFYCPPDFVIPITGYYTKCIQSSNRILRRCGYKVSTQPDIPAIELQDVMSGVYSPTEILGPGQTVHDYILLPTDMVFLDCAEAVLNNGNDPKQNARKDPFLLYDVCFVGEGDLYHLPELLEELYKNGKVYPKIHCLFDRLAFGIHEMYAPAVRPKKYVPISYYSDLGEWSVL